jgi:hypothetical protein
MLRLMDTWTSICWQWLLSDLESLIYAPIIFFCGGHPSRPSDSLLVMHIYRQLIIVTFASKLLFSVCSVAFIYKYK